MTASDYRALIAIEIDGKKAPDNLMSDIIQAVVEESIHLPGMFTLAIRNDLKPGKSDDKAWEYKELLKIGQSIKIGFGSSRTESKEYSEIKEDYVLEGEITAIETHFSETSQAPVIIHGYDVSHRLHRGRFNRSFQNMTDSDIVKKIANEVGIKVGEINDSGVPHDYVFQENQTNMEFLRERANRVGFEFFIQNSKLNFRKPKAHKEELNLAWLTDIHSFRVRTSSAEQVKEVEVRAWDYSQKRPIVSTAKKERVITDTKNGKGSDTSTSFNNQPAKPKMIVVDRPAFHPQECDRLAQALCDELAGGFVYADAKAEGNPKIRPGKVLNLKKEDMGQYGGKYYITQTRHSFVERVYTTEFNVRGLRGGDLLTMLTPKTRPQPGQTLLVGIVTDNEDPQGWGRVKVKFPTLTEEHTSNWARVVSIGAGHGRGFDCLPEIDDEVLVAFEHGDIHRPYVIGGVWNGKDAPPTSVDNSVSDSKVRLRTFKTRTGHQIQFVEEDKGGSKAGVYIETKGGHKIFLNDSEKSISLSSTGNLKIEAKGNIDINANGIITIKGSFIKLN